MIVSQRARGRCRYPGVPAPQLFAGYERSCMDLSLSWIETGAGIGGSDLWHLYPRTQQSEFHSGGRRWVEFSVELLNVQGLQPTFRVHRLYTGEGGTDWMWASGRMPTFSEDGGRTWPYFTTCTINAGAQYADFRLNRPFAVNRVRIGRSKQVSVHRCGEWLDEMAAAYPGLFLPGTAALAYAPSSAMAGFAGQSFIADELLTQVTLEGAIVPRMPVYSMRINNPALTPSLLGPTKRAFMITAGVHAGEDLSDWFFQGFCQKLLAGSSAANLLLSECDFIGVPLVNGAGRGGGGYRGGWTVNAGRDDANRNFSSTGVLDIVDRPKAALVTDLAGRVPLMSVDFHGTGNYRNGFVKDAAESLHTEFFNRIVAKTSRTWNDEADTLTGHLAGWSRGLGTQLHLTIEHGDPTPVSDAERDGICEDYIEVFAEMIQAGLFT